MISFDTQDSCVCSCVDEHSPASTPTIVSTDDHLGQSSSLVQSLMTPQPPSLSPPISQWELIAKFLTAVRENNLPLAGSILDEHYPTGRFDPDEYYCLEECTSPLIIAIERGYPKMVQLLIDFGASVTCFSNGSSPLHLAAANGSLAIVTSLLQARANVAAVSNYGSTPLHLAAQTKSHDVVEALIIAGAPLEKTDSDDRTPLANACAANRIECARILIKYGANVNVIDKNGNTPLLHSLNQYLGVNVDLIKLLLDSGANPNHMNNCGQIALVNAIRRASESNLEGALSVKELIDHNVLIDCSEISVSGENALHSAITHNQHRLVEMLIRAGADLEIKHHGLTPLDRLAVSGQLDLVKLILAAGAKPELDKQTWHQLINRRADNYLPIANIINEWATVNVQTLQKICRIKLRRFLGRKADYVIINHLIIPSSIQSFLLFNNL